MSNLLQNLTPWISQAATAALSTNTATTADTPNIKKTKIVQVLQIETKNDFQHLIVHDTVTSIHVIIDIDPHADCEQQQQKQQQRDCHYLNSTLKRQTNALISLQDWNVTTKLEAFGQNLSATRALPICSMLDDVWRTAHTAPLCLHVSGRVRVIGAEGMGVVGDPIDVNEIVSVRRCMTGIEGYGDLVSRLHSNMSRSSGSYRSSNTSTSTSTSTVTSKVVVIGNVLDYFQKHAASSASATACRASKSSSSSLYIYNEEDSSVENDSHSNKLLSAMINDDDSDDDDSDEQHSSSCNDDEGEAHEEHEQQQGIDQVMDVVPHVVEEITPPDNHQLLLLSEQTADCSLCMTQRTGSVLSPGESDELSLPNDTSVARDDEKNQHNDDAGLSASMLKLCNNGDDTGDHQNETDRCNDGDNDDVVVKEEEEHMLSNPIQLPEANILDDQEEVVIDLTMYSTDDSDISAYHDSQGGETTVTYHGSEDDDDEDEEEDEHSNARLETQMPAVSPNLQTEFDEQVDIAADDVNMSGLCVHVNKDDVVDKEMDQQQQQLEADEEVVGEKPSRLETTLPCHDIVLEKCGNLPTSNVDESIEGKKEAATGIDVDPQIQQHLSPKGAVLSAAVEEDKLHAESDESTSDPSQKEQVGNNSIGMGMASASSSANETFPTFDGAAEHEQTCEANKGKSSMYKEAAGHEHSCPLKFIAGDSPDARDYIKCVTEQGDKERATSEKDRTEEKKFVDKARSSIFAAFASPIGEVDNHIEIQVGSQITIDVADQDPALISHDGKEERAATCVEKEEKGKESNAFPLAADDFNYDEHSPTAGEDSCEQHHLPSVSTNLEQDPNSSPAQAPAETTLLTNGSPTRQSKASKQTPYESDSNDDDNDIYFYKPLGLKYQSTTLSRADDSFDSPRPKKKRKRISIMDIFEL